MDTTGSWYYVRKDLEAMLDVLFQLPEDDFVEFNSLLSVDELDALDYMRNFPHLTCLLCAVDTNDLREFSAGERHIAHSYSPSSTSMGLLPATCYKVYLGLQGQSLAFPRVVGCIAKCFRHEDKPLDHYRGLNFTMKEFVYLGSADEAKLHLDNGIAIINQLMAALDISFSYEVASDAFFDQSSSVATLARAFPTKQEVIFEGHAVASLNYHRNYFGRKFRISLGNVPIHTSCVAFGLERWVAMLRERFDDAQVVRDRLNDLSKKPELLLERIGTHVRQKGPATTMSQDVSP